MKKFLLIITLIAVMGVGAFALTACNNATTQGQLENVWYSYERYDYTVHYGDEAGTYVSEVKAQDDGYLVTGLLNVGNTEYELRCFFSLTSGSSYLVPRSTYRRQTVNGVQELLVEGTYDGSTLKYKRTTPDGTTEGDISLASPYYDNNEFHQSLRGISTFSTSLAFSYNTAIITASEATSASLTLSVSSTENVQTEVKVATDQGLQDLTVNCYKATLSRSTTVAGAAQTLYYTVEDMHAAIDPSTGETVVGAEGWKLPHVLTRIEEPYKKADGSVGYVVYVLNAISLGSLGENAEA